MPAYDKLIFELSAPGRVGYSLPEADVPNADPAALLPARHLRASPPALPEVSEFDVIRHYTRLSQLNYAVDTHFYPLGSCTMKYNPRLNEDMARLPGFAGLHPLTSPAAAQGALQLMWEL
ncbi:MAG: aminomethyl-transferring glycine dehydrogenase subunit GcvPB, partial [Candidatus Rokubacteria bacterium]|nr:aminomethyl-transferring glycine dehydrogenase subunit GcvPB [Candidatus Rokubacteria bacterium]